MIKVGYMEYANVYPIFYYLLKDKGLYFKKGFPATLNQAMREGEIDVSPSSSVEYARHADNYCIVPNICISSIGAVKSVNIFSNFKASELSGKKIYWTKESNTSTVLCRIVLEKFYNVSPVYVGERSHADAELLIGDKALYAYYHSAYPYVIDLGAEWFHFTELPFVFALWIVNKNIINLPDFRIFQENLQKYAFMSQENYSDLLKEYTDKGYTKEQIIDYWHTIDYRLTDNHLSGLKLFYKTALEIGEIPQNPELTFC